MALNAVRRRRRPPDAALGASPNSFESNATALIVSRLVVAGLGWAGTILIVRKLSHEMWGQFSFVFTFLSLMVIFTNVVSSRVALRGLLDTEDKSTYAGSYILLRLVLGILGYIVAVAFVTLGGYPDNVVLATAVAGLMLVLATPGVAYETFFQVDGRMGPVAAASVVGQTAQLALTVLLIVMGSSLVILTIPAVVCEAVSLAWRLWALRPILRVRYTVVLRTWGPMLRAGIPFAIGGALTTVYYSVDTLMLSKMDSFTAVGTYGVANKFAGIINFVPFAMGAALLAPLVRTWPHEPSEFWSTFRKAVVYLSVIAVPIAFEFALFSGPLIHLWFGASYAGAANATRLIVASECVGFFAALGVTTMVALHRETWYWVTGLAGVVVNVALNVVIIPTFSYNGAAVATLVTEVIVCALLWIPIMRLPGRPSLPLGAVGKAVAFGGASAAMAAVLVQFAPWPLAAAASGLTYGAMVHFARLAGPHGVLSLIRGATP